jgi:hypothetical protein
LVNVGEQFGPGAEALEWSDGDVEAEAAVGAGFVDALADDFVGVEF